MIIGSDNINEILSALEQQIRYRGGRSMTLVVCGGTALAALGLVDRTTKDVDVLGKLEETEEGVKVVKIDRFPQWFEEAVSVVGRDFRLPEYWLNLGPAPQLETGLPPGFEERLIKKSYGKFLTVYFISRKDQIFFKLYASVDRDDYHVQDLFALNPTEEELIEATKWVLTQDVSEDFRIILKDFLKRKGYENIAQRI